MFCRSFLVVLLLVVWEPSCGAQSYLTGKLTNAECKATAFYSDCVITIQIGGHSFSVRLAEKPSYTLEWKLNSPIQFRLTKDEIYLRRPNGSEVKIHLLIPADSGLPFPSAPPEPVQNSPAIPSEAAAPQIPHCAEIAAMGPQFKLLSNACQFALSPQNLPNFVCQETMQRATSGSTRANWKALDLITMEVTSLDGGKDRYSNFAVNGKQVKKQPPLGGGWLDFAGFDVELATIFDPMTRTSFTFIGDVSLPSGLAATYGFQFHSADNHKLRQITRHKDFHPGLSGSLWIGKHSGNLLRMEAYAKELDPGFPLNFYSSNNNYGEVPISNIGTFLLPAARETIFCNGSGDDVHCSKDTLSFHDCRKFGTEAHIIPDAGEHH